jgi:hypothetical protein
VRYLLQVLCCCTFLRYIICVSDMFVDFCTLYSSEVADALIYELTCFICKGYRVSNEMGLCLGRVNW